MSFVVFCSLVSYVFIVLLPWLPINEKTEVFLAESGFTAAMYLWGFLFLMTGGDHGII